ncbi:MAG: hypothetical protein JNK02_03375 [Planctomycetes bacterium]|nr:hypothetical protein [Planctomycetota bacterium]
MEEPLHRSKPTAKSLWQEYRLFPDRIELDSIPWGTVRVPLEDVKAVAVRPPGVIFDLFRGDYGLGELMRAPKLDLADLAEHVALEKTGFWKQFRFTPDDPVAFKAAVDRALAARRRTQER